MQTGVRKLGTRCILENAKDDTPYSASWFSWKPPPPLSATLADPRPSNLHLVIMGDSVMRYQYLSFAYFLRYGVWFDPNEHDPHLVYVDSYSRGRENLTGEAWALFYSMSHDILSPYERVCDCYRGVHDWGNQSTQYKVTENRYFWDASRNNSIVYIQAFSPHKTSLHGRLQSQETASLLKDTATTEKYRHSYSPPTWSFIDWGDAIENYIAKLQPAPSHLVLSIGLHEAPFSNETFRNSVLRAIQLISSVHNIQTIWRTTPYKSHHMPRSVQQEDGRMFLQQHDQSFSFLDTSWTKHLSPKYFWNAAHYYEPVYRVLNEDLLRVIGHSFPPRYQAQDRATLLKPSPRFL